jgi:hypothetical protein
MTDKETLRTFEEDSEKDEKDVIKNDKFGKRLDNCYLTKAVTEVNMRMTKQIQETIMYQLTQKHSSALVKKAGLAPQPV